MRIKPIKIWVKILINDNISKKIVALASITSKCTILEGQWQTCSHKIYL